MKSPTHQVTNSPIRVILCPHRAIGIREWFSSAASRWCTSSHSSALSTSSFRCLANAACCRHLDLFVRCRSERRPACSLSRRPTARFVPRPGPALRCPFSPSQDSSNRSELSRRCSYGLRCGSYICRSSTSARSSTGSGGRRCFSKPDFSPCSRAADRPSQACGRSGSGAGSCFA